MLTLGFEPRPRLVQRLNGKPEVVLAAVDLPDDDPGVLEHLEVPRDGGL